MAYINLQPSNSLSERFVLGGHFNLKMQGLGMTDMSDFSPRQDPVTSLRKYTSYQISVTPYNKQGTGPASSSVVASTMEDGKPILFIIKYLVCPFPYNISENYISSGVNLKSVHRCHDTFLRM